MPKTRDAFALRDFDAGQILQRKRFGASNDSFKEGLFFILQDLSQFKFVDDNEILWQYANRIENAFDSDDFVTASKNIAFLRAVLWSLGEYDTHLFRHVNRLLEFISRLLVDDDRTNRARALIEKYLWAHKTILKRSKFLKRDLSKIEDTYNSRVRSEFAVALRKARKATGMTQTALAEAICTTQTSYSNYEQGVAFPPIPRLRMLAKILNISVDRLLGLS